MKKKFYNVSESYGFGLKQFLGSTLFYSDYIRKVLFFYYKREGGKVKKKQINTYFLEITLIETNYLAKVCHLLPYIFKYNSIYPQAPPK